jgi:hypothetical protein
MCYKDALRQSDLESKIVGFCEFCPSLSLLRNLRTLSKPQHMCLAPRLMAEITLSSLVSKRQYDHVGRITDLTWMTHFHMHISLLH